MKKVLTILISICLLTQLAHAQAFDKAKLDAYFDTLSVNNKFMGTVAVSENGKTIYTRAVGYADVNNKVHADINTKYRIGSISKTFTAVLVIKAVEQGKLKLEQTIDKYFPAIKNADKITISQLLHHQSGIHNFTSDDDYLSWNTQPQTEKNLVTIIAKEGSDFEPGSKFEYSNSNYVLLTFILEKTFHKPYSELLQQYITNPLQLTHTYLGGEINTQKGESKSYDFEDKWVVQPETDISIPLGAGGIVSTSGDLVKFSNALFGGRLLTAERLKQMEEPKDGYGMGLFPVRFYDSKGYGHTGGIDGFTSVMYHLADSNISFALTSNGSNYSNKDIATAVVSALYGKPYDIPKFSHYKNNPDDLDQYLGVYSSAQLPIKITITKEEQQLMAQATGQPSFPLEPTAKNTFAFDKAGVALEFNPSGHTMTLNQAGHQFIFTKE